MMHLIFLLTDPNIWWGSIGGILFAISPVEGGAQARTSGVAEEIQGLADGQLSSIEFGVHPAQAE